MAKKKKSKTTLLPWCWYCEREFEDEKVLMQHQKAKHFKCRQCPRRLNTAGGLAVHIQQVHKLDPDKIDNALPGRDGYDVEIFGMEGIPPSDMADYKRRKEAELGLAPGSISGSGREGPQMKRARFEQRVLTETELRAALHAHIALMGAGETKTSKEDAQAVYGAEATTYAAPAPVAIQPPFPGAGPPGYPMPPPGMPFPPPGMGGPPGMPPFPPPPGFPMPPPGMLGPPGMPPPPFGLGPPPSGPPVGFGGPPPPPSFVPASHSHMMEEDDMMFSDERVYRPGSDYKNPALKDEAILVWKDANLSPEEQRSTSKRYAIGNSAISSIGLLAAQEELRRMQQGPGAGAGGGGGGLKRARAEDFL